MHPWRSKLTSLIILLVLFLCDLGLNLCTLLSVHEWSWHGLVKSDLNQQFRDFTADVMDLCGLAILRIIILTILGFLTVRFGTPPYELAQDRRKYAVMEREEMIYKWKKERGIMNDSDEERGANSSSTSSKLPPTLVTDEKREPLLLNNHIQDHTLHSDGEVIHSHHHPHDKLISTIAVSDDPDNEYSDNPALSAFISTLPPLPPSVTLTEHEKMEESRRSTYLRHTFVACIFIIASLMQVYAGIKMVGFHFTHEWTQAILLGLGIICVNAEQSLLRHIIVFLCTEEGYLFLKLHPHRLYYDETTGGHICDLCRVFLRTSYSCSQCDFDCCPKCFAKQDKSRGEGLVRGDKGAKDEQEVSSTAYLLRALKLARPHLPIIVVGITCLLLTSAASIWTPNLQGNIFDSVIHGETSAFAHDIKIYILLNVGLGFFGAIRTLAWNIVGSHMSMEVRNKLFRAIIVQDIVFFDGASTGDLTSTLSYQTSAMTSPMQTVLSSTLSDILTLGGGLIMCLITSWRLTVLAMTSIYPIIIITREYAEWSAMINNAIWAALGDASDVATQAISNIRTVRSFGTEDQEVKRFSAATLEAQQKSIKDAYANGATFALTNYLDLATSVLILWYGGGVALGEHAGDLTVGKLIAFELYWGMMNSAYTSFLSSLNQFTQASGAAQKVLTLMDSLPDIDLNTGTKLTHVKGEISIQDLTFAYQMRPENPVLKGVSLHIPANTVTAIVGRSGGGKSTLVHLLMRFYDPTSGSISLDGHTYSTLNFKSVHQHMAVVTQNTELFSGTIKENLVYGMPEEGTGSWTIENVHEACRQANAHDFIQEFEEGYDTRVGERGVRLSGGQKQRLSIARAMLRKSRILFLDEATSALDAESEHLVQSALDRLIAQRGCTILLVAHRLSTVMNADQICVLDGGVIKERGTHDQLLQIDNGIYSKLVQRQLARKQNIIEDEQVTNAIAGSVTQKEAKDAQEKLKQKKEKLDDFDSLFDEEEEKEQLEKARATASHASSPTNAGTSAAATSSASSNATLPKRET